MSECLFDNLVLFKIDFIILGIIDVRTKDDDVTDEGNIQSNLAEWDSNENKKIGGTLKIFWIIKVSLSSTS